MSITYSVIQGDTFELISRKVYGVATEAGRIKRANPGTAEPLPPGITLVIPDLPGRPLGVSANQPSADPDETALIVDGKRFRFWEEISIENTIDSFSKVSFSAPFEAARGDFTQAFTPFSYRPVEVIIGGELQFRGVMLAPVPTVEPNRKRLTVSCYALPAVMNDCNPPASAFPLEFNGFGLRDICLTIAGYFGLGVDFRVGEGAVFDSVACTPGEKAFAFLTDLAKQRNVILSNNADGELLAWRSITSGLPVAKLRQGESPLVSVTPFFKPQTYYSEVTGIEPAVVGLKGSTYTVKNPFLRGVIRPFTFEAPDTIGADLKTAVEAKAGRMFGEMVSYKVSVNTWRDPSGVLWRPNTVLNLFAPDASVYQEYNFIIRSVSLSRDRANRSAELEVVLPGSFSGEIPEALPWAG